MKLDARQVKSKEKLQAAYLSLIIEGYDQLTIQQVCSKAAVTRPTFYKLYKDIKQLRKAMIEDLLLELKQALTIINPKPLDEITEAEKIQNLTLLFEHVHKNHIAYETLLINQTDALFTNGIQEIIKAYVRSGIYFSQTQQYLLNINEELIVSYVSGAYLECVRWWISNNYEPSEIEMAQILIQIALHGPYTKYVKSL